LQGVCGLLGAYPSTPPCENLYVSCEHPWSRLVLVGDLILLSRS
jgi:hypothetical protein